jgi:hypothetical protein
VVALEPVEVGESAHQISYRHDMLTFRSPAVDRIDPLFSSPTPESPLALCRLTKKEQQYILAVLGDDAGIVQGIADSVASTDRKGDASASPFHLPVETPIGRGIKAPNPGGAEAKPLRHSLLPLRKRALL